jgi:aldose 1-epimerase
VSETPRRGGSGADYVLQNGQGVRAHLVATGASLRELHLPDRTGALADVVLGFDRAAEYTRNPASFGCTIGRCANRIDRAQFVLDGKTYRLSRNAGAQHLHGGHLGFGRREWRVRAHSPTSTTFELESPDGEEGYPAQVVAEVRYTLTEDGALIIDERAAADAPTIINLTNHTYFNLADGGTGHVLDHVLALASDEVTPLRDDFIPTGERMSVAGTPLDFRSACRIGGRIREVDRSPVGYDHNYVVAGADGALRNVAWLRDPASGRTLELATTKPGVQLYTGNFLDGSQVGKRGTRYQQHAGLCLETQHFPDTPNHPQFPSIRYQPGRDYAERTVWRFGVEHG